MSRLSSVSMTATEGGSTADGRPNQRDTNASTCGRGGGVPSFQPRNDWATAQTASSAVTGSRFARFAVSCSSVTTRRKGSPLGQRPTLAPYAGAGAADGANSPPGAAPRSAADVPVPPAARAPGAAQPAIVSATEIAAA